MAIKRSWEYMRLVASDENWNQYFQTHGRLGWELVSVIHEDPTAVIGYFKREMEE